MIELKNVSKCFGNQKILEDSSYIFKGKGITAIVGESGSGKTTILNLISGIEKPDCGKIFFDGTDLTQLSKQSLCDFRLNNIGFVFQNYNLLELENGYTNVAVLLDANSNNTERFKKRKVKAIFSMLNITYLLKQKVNKMSGGEKQRVSIARALINNPKVILCDEPTGALDDKNSQQILDILKKVSINSQVIIVTHDLERIKKYADEIITINECKIMQIKASEISDKNTQEKGSDIEKIKHGHLSIGFKIKHSFSLIKEKKVRTIFSNLMLSISLTGIGTSFVLVNSVDTSIQNAFNSLTNGNQIVMKLKNENINSYSNVYSAPLASINYLYSEYHDEINGIGVNYSVNYEDFFKDRNSCYVVNGVKRILIPGLTARYFNEYKWYSENIVTFPISQALDDDDIVLGLPYETMSNLAYELGIKRTYSAFGEYIRFQNLQLSFEVSNFDWEYEDEQIFNIVGITQANRLTIYHSNHLWNEYVFEEHMRFPTSSTGETYFPWEMQKLYYITVKNTDEFLNNVIFDENFYDYVFQKSSFKFLETLCDSSKICGENRIFVYLVDKEAIHPSHVLNIIDLYPELSNFLFTSNYGYSSYSSNLLNGFSNNFFVSFDDLKIDQAIDAETSLTTSETINIDLPSGIVSGNYLNGLDGGLKFSTQINKLVSGRKPENKNEIVISSGLANKLENPNPTGNYLILAGQISDSIDSENKLIKDYQRAQAVVVGIADEERDYIYGNSLWTIEFFRDNLGIDSFSLIPTGTIFEINDNLKIDEIIERLSKLFTEYSFSSPQTEVSKSLNSTLDYAQTILLIFSIASLIISLLLLATIVLISVNELKNEILLFNYVGISKNEVFSMISIQSVLRGLIAFAISFFEIIAIENVLSIATGQILHQNSFTFLISWQPLLVVFLSATILPILVTRLILLVLSFRKRVE